MNNVIQLNAYKEELISQNQEVVLMQYIQLVKLSNCSHLSKKRVDLIMHETLINEIEVSMSKMFGIIPSFETNMKFSTAKYKESIHEVLNYAKTQSDSIYNDLNNLIKGVSTLLALEQKIPVDYDYGHDIFCRYSFDAKYLENNPQIEEIKKLDGIFAQRKLNTIIASQNMYLHKNVQKSEKIKLKM